MDYCLLKLHFDRAVHFGTSDSSLSLYSTADHFCADTLFSALCHTARALYGDAGIEKLCKQAESGELLLSDSMPWRNENGKDIFFLPKPCISSESKQDIPAQLRKRIKKQCWMPINDVDNFQSALSGKKQYVPNDAPFGVMDTRTFAAIKDDEDTRPYQVETFRFFPNCGLYFLAACNTKEQFQELYQLVQALGLSGIGGKVTSGLGTFSVEPMVMLRDAQDQQLRWLQKALARPNPKHYLLLTTSLPQEDELATALENAQYQLVRRGGYVQSDTFSNTPQRKSTQYFLSAGAMLTHSFSGALFNTVKSGKHPVYRYAKPIMLGVFF